MVFNHEILVFITNLKKEEVLMRAVIFFLSRNIMQYLLMADFNDYVFINYNLLKLHLGR